MQIINARSILLIQLYLFLKITTKNRINSFRITSESNLMIPFTSNMSCSEVLDCFNCTTIPKCRWSWENESCIFFNSSNINYSIPLLSPYNNDIGELNNYINFIRKSCFRPVIPFIKNENYFNYDNISIKYCGNHYIIRNEYNIRNNFKLEINNVEGFYGTPNLLCEFIFLSVPSFQVNIEINKEEKNNFYLLYSENSLNFKENINTSRNLYISSSPKILNTFVFYCLKSFDKSPFIITYQEDIIKKATEVAGYILVGLGSIMVVIIVLAIVYIRKKLMMLKKEEKSIQLDEGHLLKKHYSKKNSEEIKLNENKTIGQIPKYIDNFTPPTNTPTHLLNEQKFRYDICCVDGKIIENLLDIKTANCGHFYHVSCFKELIQEMNDKKEKELKCFSCKKVIYP